MVIYVLNIAYLFMFIALAIRDILILRVVLVSAQTLFIIYSSITGNFVVLLWNCLFLAINLFQVIVLLRRRKPLRVPDDIRDIRERIFGEMSTSEFLFFWQIGRETDCPGGTLVEEGSAQEEVMLLLEGAAAVLKHGREIATLERGSFVAEMSFLSGEPASATVECRTPVKIITWNQQNLRNMKTMNFSLWSKVQHVLTKDLVGKVRATSDRLTD